MDRQKTANAANISKTNIYRHENINKDGAISLNVRKKHDAKMSTFDQYDGCNMNESSFKSPTKTNGRIFVNEIR